MHDKKHNACTAFLFLLVLCFGYFSQINQSHASDTEKSITPLAVDDYEVDAASYIGKSVYIEGVTMCLTPQMCTLYKQDLSELQGITYDPSSLARETRKRLLSCNIYVKKCLVILYAVGTDPSTFSIMKATDMYWWQDDTNTWASPQISP